MINFSHFLFSQPYNELSRSEIGDIPTHVRAHLLVDKTIATNAIADIAEVKAHMATMEKGEGESSPRFATTQRNERAQRARFFLR